MGFGIHGANQLSTDVVLVRMIDRCKLLLICRYSTACLVLYRSLHVLLGCLFDMLVESLTSPDVRLNTLKLSFEPSLTASPILVTGMSSFFHYIQISIAPKNPYVVTIEEGEVCGGLVTVIIDGNSMNICLAFGSESCILIVESVCGYVQFMFIYLSLVIS